MIKHTKLLLAIAAALFSVAASAADKDMLVLLKQLSKQVEELKVHSAQSDERIRELENSLEKEREKNRQVAVAAPKEPVTASVPAEVVAVPVAVIAGPKEEAAAEPKQQAKPAVTLGDTKGTLKIPGTDTSVGIGGYVKLDITESSTGAAANTLGDYQLTVSQIPVRQRTGGNSQLAFNARETRIWLKSFTPSRWGDVNTYLEMDLYGSAYAYAPNLRHAYGTFGNLLAGQTWTTFVNDRALPDTLDNGGPVGTTKVRQPMLRWTQPFSVSGESLEFLSAVEAPNSLILTNNPPPATNPITPGANWYPDLVARLNYLPEWGNLSLAGMARDIRYTTTPIAGASQDAWGGAVSLAGKINVLSLDNIRFSLNYGNVLGRYLTYQLEDAALNTLNNAPASYMSLVNSYSAMFAYQHWWTDRWRSNLVYGFEKADLPAFVSQATLMTQQAQSLHANLLWSPLPQATLGLEYIYATRTLIDGGSGNISRAQLSAKYSF